MQQKVIVALGVVVLVTLFLFMSSTPSEGSYAQLQLEIAKEREARMLVDSSRKHLQNRFMELARDTLCGIIFATTERGIVSNTTVEWSEERSRIPPLMNVDSRRVGLDWPLVGITMVGQVRLNNLLKALKDVVYNNIPGDMIECGVWRGGASIFAKLFFDRDVWVVDSFEGLPPNRTAMDVGGWDKLDFFVDSLPNIKVKQIAVLRMDGDMYESTMDQLFNLYDKVSIGGWIIVDDYSIRECARAIADFRTWHDITEPIVQIDWTGVYWIKQKQVEIQKSHYQKLLGKT